MKGRKLARRQIPRVLQRRILYILREIHKKVLYTIIKLLLIVFHVFLWDMLNQNVYFRGAKKKIMALRYLE